MGRPAQRGFTLIELLMTVAIVGLLATVALPLSELVVRREQERDLRVALREIRTALDNYKQAADEGRIARAALQVGYPATLVDLVDGVPDMTDPNRARKLRFLRRIPRDPLDRDPNKPAEATWGKRSYASDPDRPEEGEDVFDVYSRSSGTGLNGIAYRKW